MKKSGLVFAFLVVLALVAALTCPPQVAHEAAMKAVVRTTIEEWQAEAKVQGGGGGMLGGYLGQMLGQMMAKEMMKGGLMTYKSFGLFSISEVNWDGKTYPVGIGTFGYVYISDRVQEKVLQGIDTAKKTMEKLGG